MQTLIGLWLRFGTIQAVFKIRTTHGQQLLFRGFKHFLSIKFYCNLDRK
jgi:hypothetical protein